MEAKGIIRNIDDLGRVVIPREMRKAMHIVTGDSLNIVIRGDSIVLTPYRNHCIFCEKLCQAGEHMEKKNGVFVCRSCLDELYKGGNHNE